MALGYLRVGQELEVEEKLAEGFRKDPFQSTKTVKMCDPLESATWYNSPRRSNDTGCVDASNADVPCLFRLKLFSFGRAVRRVDERGHSRGLNWAIEANLPKGYATGDCILRQLLKNATQARRSHFSSVQRDNYSNAVGRGNARFSASSSDRLRLWKLSDEREETGPALLEDRDQRLVGREELLYGKQAALLGY